MSGLCRRQDPRCHPCGLCNGEPPPHRGNRSRQPIEDEERRRRCPDGPTERTLQTENRKRALIGDVTRLNVRSPISGMKPGTLPAAWGTTLRQPLIKQRLSKTLQAHVLLPNIFNDSRKKRFSIRWSKSTWKPSWQRRKSAASTDLAIPNMSRRLSTVIQNVAFFREVSRNAAAGTAGTNF